MTTPRRRAPLVLSAAALVAALTGCGGGADGSTGTATRSGSSSAATAVGGAVPDPCGLITADDLSDAYDTTYGEGVAADSEVVTPDAGLRACRWKAADTDTTTFLLQVTSSDALGRDVAAFYDQVVALYDDTTPAEVGDRAVLLADAGLLTVSGEYFLQANLVDISGEAPNAAAITTVMTTAVANLP